MLAEANEPQLRLIVMDVLREHPIPANRAILEKLLRDSDQQVRSAAEQIAKELEKLRETSPVQLAAGTNQMEVQNK
jgi:CheY-like chemotaxis protein